jgi:hypothetical protein
MVPRLEVKEIIADILRLIKDHWLLDEGGVGSYTT